ncbi:hypothetical protein KDI_21980 [Dictyobacter arantiisoli]|uniref:Uncharacterized protein n=1 Tax=Dictyobacter arantiisoli TaxID=2014874 RepID=A0A5A5TCF8_9CHLR|nr:hypothetical protein KDI_21980 [Dictyobacter arantiisoli]
MGSGFPRKRCPNAHDSEQVCMFQGKNGRDFRAFLLKTLLKKDRKIPLAPSSMAQFIRDGLTSLFYGVQEAGAIT